MMKYLCSIKDNKKFLVGLVLLFVIIFFTFFFVTKTVVASGSKINGPKLVTSIKVEEGDSLWSIATEYRTEEYTNIATYIDEIKRSNGLESDTIHEGQYLIIPYYVSMEN